MNFYPYPWSPGTIYAKDMPANYYAQLSSECPGGIVPVDYPVHEAATEGPYIGFAGYKVRVTIVSNVDDTYTAKLA